MTGRITNKFVFNFLFVQTSFELHNHLFQFFAQLSRFFEWSKVIKLQFCCKFEVRYTTFFSGFITVLRFDKIQINNFM